MTELLRYIRHQVHGYSSRSYLLYGAVWRDDEDAAAMIRRPTMQDHYRICHRLCHPAANSNEAWR